MYTDVERAYLAGLLDGEGTILIATSAARANRETRTHALQVTVSNTHMATMERLHARWGGSLSIRHFSSRMSTRPIAVLRWNSISAANLLREIFPFMEIKRGQAEAALTFADELALRPKRTSAVTREEWYRREELRLRIKLLNSPTDTNVPMPYPEIPAQPCAWCGESFDGYMSRKRKYCSNSCAMKASRANYNERQKALAP